MNDPPKMVYRSTDENRKKVIGVTKILEKMYGKRCLLICEKNVTKEGNASIKLIGNGKEIETTCYVLRARGCFSEPKVLQVLLPGELGEKELKSVETIEFI